jgi:hypothetical protein
MQRREPSSGEAAAKPAEVVARPFLRRIEKLTRTFLGGQFKSSDDLWRFQLGLLQLQRDIQAAINDYKLRVKREKCGKEILTELRSCLWHAKRLGDALAWIALGRDIKTLEPLSRNNRTSTSPEDHGSRGMLLMARYLASQGKGFPLIHDITDCLRIGDVTYVRVLENSERSYTTVEVKTHAEFKGRLEGQNLAEYEYRILAFSASPFDGAHADPAALESADFTSIIPRSAGPLSRPIDRQAKRMSTALSHQNAEPNTLIEEDGAAPAVWAAVNTPVTAHWKSLQRVVRKARRSGYGSECVDDTFLYVAFYSPEGVSPESVDHASHLQEDLSSSPLVIRDGSRANVLSIATIPTIKQAGAHLFLPFYLYPIPRSSIYDLIHGRMVIFVCYNNARLVESLEEAGLNVEVNTKTRQLTVTRSVTTDGGADYYIQSPDLRYYLDKIIYEFYGRDLIVQAAKAVLDVAENVTAELDRESRREGFMPGNTEPTNQGA